MSAELAKGTGHAGDFPPSEWVVRFASLIAPGGHVLDLACGSGRHARLLRDLGHAVVAVDRDESALEAMGGETGITALHADLESAPWPFAPGTFDAVVVTNYLHRTLFGHLLDALRIGGVLIYETFALGNERYGRPGNPDFLLSPGELLRLTNPLQVLAFEQGIVDLPKTAVVQRICSVRPLQSGALNFPIPVARLGALR